MASDRRVLDLWVVDGGALAEEGAGAYPLLLADGVAPARDFELGGRYCFVEGECPRGDRS
jgi:hypothetical protein